MNLGSKDWPLLELRIVNKPADEDYPKPYLALEAKAYIYESFWIFTRKKEIWITISIIEEAI